MAPSEKRNFVVQMYESEYRQIQAWVDKYQHLETGGDLFGLWADDHTAVVQLVLGPGEHCRRTSVSFYQDINYLERVGNILTTDKGLCHIGEWHSHHRIGLTRPSGGDENTVWTNMDRYGINRFFLFIATIDYYDVNVGCFLFENHPDTKRRKPVLKGTIQPFGNEEEESPFRKNIQKYLAAGAESENSKTSLKKFKSNVTNNEKHSAGKRSWYEYDEQVRDKNEPRTKVIAIDREIDESNKSEVVKNENKETSPLTQEAETLVKEAESKSLPLSLKKFKQNDVGADSQNYSTSKQLQNNLHEPDYKKPKLQETDFQEESKTAIDQEMKESKEVNDPEKKPEDVSNKYTEKPPLTKVENQNQIGCSTCVTQDNNDRIEQQSNLTEENNKSETLKTQHSASVPTQNITKASSSAKSAHVTYMGGEFKKQEKEEGLHDGQGKEDTSTKSIPPHLIIHVKPAASEEEYTNQQQPSNATMDQEKDIVIGDTSETCTESAFKDSQENKDTQSSATGRKPEEITLDNETKILPTVEKPKNIKRRWSSKKKITPEEKKEQEDKKKEEKENKKKEKETEKKQKKEEKENKKKEKENKKKQKKDEKQKKKEGEETKKKQKKEKKENKKKEKENKKKQKMEEKQKKKEEEENKKKQKMEEKQKKKEKEENKKKQKKEEKENKNKEKEEKKKKEKEKKKIEKKPKENEKDKEQKENKETQLETSL